MDATSLIELFVRVGSRGDRGCAMGSLGKDQGTEGRSAFHQETMQVLGCRNCQNSNSSKSSLDKVGKGAKEKCVRFSNGMWQVD